MISGVFVLACDPAPERVEYFGNTPAEFRALSRDKAFSRRDPVMRRLKHFTAPFVYDRSTYLDADAGDLWDIQAGYGFRTGLAVSLHLPEGQHFVIGVDREESLSDDPVVVTRLIADFNLLAVHAQLAVQRLLASDTYDASSCQPLSKREIEILKWTNEGKSAWAVGRILSISEHTVNFHVQKVLMKLNVSSKHQAAAKARSLGLI